MTAKTGGQTVMASTILLARFILSDAAPPVNQFQHQHNIFWGKKLEIL